MIAGDVPAIAALARAVWGVGADRWTAAQLEAGDVAFVARVEGKIVGFAFAAVAREEARLHTLTVDPAFRDRGIGTELIRARLHGLAALGVTAAISEIAESNVASRHLAIKHGFTAHGKLFLVAHAIAAERKFVRR